MTFPPIGPTMTDRVTAGDIRSALLDGRELAILDVREEGIFAEAHPLFAASLPCGRIEMEAFDRIPRLTTPVVVYDSGEGLAERAARRFGDLGYMHVGILEGGLDGWRRAGGELFRDVNVPSKAFGELVDAERHTPSMSAQELKSLLDEGANVVVLDARRFEEYHTMSIPSSINVPGAELVFRVGELAPRPETMVVVNCAGRTRSVIGAQSLVNAGLPNRVAALRNGTIGWSLAGIPLERGQNRRFPEISAGRGASARAAARRVADRAGVGRIDRTRLAEWSSDPSRTTYRFDVRTPEEFAAGHPPGFRSAAGGQLVQEADVFAPVRGARIVLFDNRGVRADMTASWLAQMGWHVHVLDDRFSADEFEFGPWRARHPEPPPVRAVTPAELVTLLNTGTVLLDVAPSVAYLRGHIPGAWLISRTHLDRALKEVPRAQSYVITSHDGVLGTFAVPEVAGLTGAEVMVLAGGTDAWRMPLEPGPTRLAGPVEDVYKRPYEGTDNAHSAMQAYLEWEYGLVAQLQRDGTHGFRVI